MRPIGRSRDDHLETIRDFITRMKGGSFDFGIFSRGHFEARGARFIGSFIGRIRLHAVTSRMHDKRENMEGEGIYWRSCSRALVRKGDTIELSPEGFEEK